MATILVKNLPEDLLKDLKRLKVELGCDTWADLLNELVAVSEETMQKNEKTSQTEIGIKNFLDLKSSVTSKWEGPSTVLKETRRSRHHETP
jgi:hypothetical protein